MSRILISATAIFVLVFSTLVTPLSVSACEEEPPSTLLALYEASDAIYVATYRKVEDVETLETGEDYTRVQIRKHYDISSTLRGENRKMVALEEEDYRYKTTDEAGEPVTDEHAEWLSEIAQPGDRVILFLKKGEDGKTLAPAHYRDAVKKMTAEDLATYEKRIGELNGIFAKAKNRDAEIVEWLIRLIEDPVTRWEGASELARGFETIEWQEEAAKQDQPEPASGEDEPATGEETEAVVERDVTKYARLLTPEQKQRISAVLLRDDRPAEGEKKETAKLTQGDMALIDLVKRWGDASVADVLVQRLRNGVDDKYEKSAVMQSVAAILKDDGVKAAADQYGENAWGEDNEIVGEEGNGDAAETPEQPEGEDGGEEGENAKPKKQTYLELRAEIFGKFLAAADAVLSKAKNKEVAKAVK